MHGWNHYNYDLSLGIFKPLFSVENNVPKNPMEINWQRRYWRWSNYAVDVQKL